MCRKFYKCILVFGKCICNLGITVKQKFKVPCSVFESNKKISVFNLFSTKISWYFFPVQNMNLFDLNLVNRNLVVTHLHLLFKSI